MKDLLRYCLAAALLCAAVARGQDVQRVNGERLNGTMEAMQQFGRADSGGSIRVAFSEANAEALTYLAGLMQEAGMTTRIDFAGNLVGRLQGQEENLQPLITGSHVDTVPNGGHYDGIVGVMAAIEVAQTLRDTGARLRHPLEVIVWSNEEGGKTGSRSFNGSIRSEELALPSLGERSLGAGMDFLGGNASRLQENERAVGSMAGYVELHVEQGAVLDREGLDIGVVEGIVGIRRWNVTVDGFANHAGTTPMNQRQDALLTAAQIITAIREQITALPGTQVGTVGRIAAYPGAPNVIPGRVVFSLEIRDLSMDKIGSLLSAIERAATAIAAGVDATVNFEMFYESPAAPTEPALQDMVANAAADLELTFRTMPSGAGHDAQSLAPLGPIAMIFIPSIDGISHAPDEFSTPGDIVNGANVLLQTILRMDASLP